MLLSLRWLNKIFPSGLSAEEILDLIRKAGLDIERTTDLGIGSGKIVVAEVLEVEKHPDADRLVVTKVNIGAEKPSTIVCGATNLVVGMFVPCALPGAKLPDGTEIRKTKIRGQESEGMLCSARELAFGADHSGILELPNTYKVGEPFDFIVDIKVTPNRADCLSVLGIARDVAAMVGKKVYPATTRFTETLIRTEEFIDLMVQARDACPRYTCRYITEVVIGPSPLWIQRALQASGFRPINNVVDITNFVMLELGIPLHAFDFDRLRGGKIIVRHAKEGEKLTTLDETELQLDPEDLVIADAERPVALAGVMGGKNTEVSDATTHIALECAYFDPATIRKTVRRHGLKTDSGQRFERGTDRSKLSLALNRATQLMHEFAKGEIAKGFLEFQQPQGDEPVIPLEVSRVNQLLGLELSNSDVADRLVMLGFEIRQSDRGSLHVAKPPYRMDIEADVDLIEEVARIYGYDNIPQTMPAIPAGRLKDDEPLPPWDLIRQIRSTLIGLGFSEVLNTGLLSEDAARRHGHDPAALVHIANPLTAEQSVLRPSLAPDLLSTAAFNQHQGAERIAIFEIGKVFPPGARVGVEEDEGLALGIVLAGARPRSWAAGAAEYDFHDLKGALETLGESLNLGDLATEKIQTDPTYHPGRSGLARWQKDIAGKFGELHPDQAAHYDLRGRVHFAELDLAKLIQLVRSCPVRYQPISKFPASERDLALIVDETVDAAKVVTAARRAGKPLVEELSVVDLYRGDHIPAGKKSIAMRFRLRSADATLTDGEISAAMEKILAELKSQCGAMLRS